MARKELETIQRIPEFNSEDLQHFSPNDTEYFEEALKEIAYYETEFGRIKAQNQILRNYITIIENAFKIDSSNIKENVSSIIEFVKENNLGDKYKEWKMVKEYEEPPEDIELEISRLENELNGEIPGYIRSQKSERENYYISLKNHVKQLNKIREVMKRKRGK